MSAANFYILDGGLLAELHEAATPVEREISVKKLFFTQRKSVLVDSFGRFVRERAREVDALEGSGPAFAALDRMLCRRGFASMFSDRRLANNDAAVAFFDRNLAEALVAELKKAQPTPVEVAAFVQEFAGVADSSAAQAILAALRQLHVWLTGIPPGTVGILAIGVPEDE